MRDACAAGNPLGSKAPKSIAPLRITVPVRRSHCLPPLLCTAVFILPAAAIAADTSDSRLASTDATLGEVVVTAQKRTETIRAVPQSVSVLSGEQIEMQ